jgi:hypothetical protein
MCRYILYDKLSSLNSSDMCNPYVKHVQSTRVGSIRRETCMILLGNLPLLLLTVTGTQPTVACNWPVVACTRLTVACTRPIVTYVMNLSHQLSVDVSDKSVGYY